MTETNDQITAFWRKALAALPHEEMRFVQTPAGRVVEDDTVLASARQLYDHLRDLVGSPFVHTPMGNDHIGSFTAGALDGWRVIVSVTKKKGSLVALSAGLIPPLSRPCGTLTAHERLGFAKWCDGLGTSPSQGAA